MKRIERARIIHRQVIEIAKSTPTYRHVNSGLAAIAETDLWHARIHTTENPRLGWQPLLVEVPRIPSQFLGRRSLPNRMGLWLTQGPKILTVEWMNDRFVLVNMRRGSWEFELFGLPVYNGKAALPEYELFRRRSRRW